MIVILQPSEGEHTTLLDQNCSLGKKKNWFSCQWEELKSWSWRCKVFFSPLAAKLSAPVKSFCAPQGFFFSQNAHKRGQWRWCIRLVKRWGYYLHNLRQCQRLRRQEARKKNLTRGVEGPPPHQLFCLIPSRFFNRKRIFVLDFLDTCQRVFSCVSSGPGWLSNIRIFFYSRNSFISALNPV